MRRIFLFLLLVSVAFNCHAQYYDDDLRLWLTLALNKNITKKFGVDLALQSRIDENISEPGRMSVVLSANYKVKKYFRVVGSYMSGERKTNEGFKHFNRFYLGFTLRKNVGGFIFMYRNLTQYQPEGNFIFGWDEVPSVFNRNKFVLRRSINKRWTLYISEELNIPLTYGYKFDYLSRSRTVLGTIFHFSERVSIEPFILFQRKFTFKNQPKRDFVGGLTLGIDLK